MSATETEPLPEVASTRQITEEILRDYWEQDERRKALDRQARQIETAQKLVAGQIEAALKAEGKPELKRGEFRAQFVAGSAYVHWKHELIKLAGPEKANEIQQAAAPSRRLAVTKIGG